MGCNRLFTANGFNDKIQSAEYFVTQSEKGFVMDDKKTAVNEDIQEALERVTVEQAVDLLLKNCGRIRETEHCPLFECSGRILAEDITALNHQPPFDRSPVDGYACRSCDILNASREHPVCLKVVEEINAGSWPAHDVGSGQAARIMTGAPIPKGADCCVYQENTDYGEALAAIYESCPKYGNYCFRGEDIEAGTAVLREGTRLSYVEAGILAGLGLERAPVFRRPRAAVLASGDELMEPGTPLKPGKIYDSNLYFLAVRLKELGIEVSICRRIPDDEKTMAKAISDACAQVDLIITTGGVSVGKRDIMHEALAMAGAKRLFWRILMKPGMPTIASVLEGIPVISLSGNPFGALADFELLCRPVFEAMTGDSFYAPKKRQAVLAQDFPKASPSRRFIRGRLEAGTVRIPEIKKHASGIFSSMAGCNCLVDIPAGTSGLRAGESVTVFRLTLDQ